MSLTFPPLIGDQFPASEVAKKNFKILERVDPRGPIEQVATQLAMGKLDRIRELEPTYLDAALSLTKFSVIYVSGLAVAGTAIGGLGYGAVCAYDAQYSLAAIGGSMIVADWLAGKMGSSLTHLGYLYFQTVNTIARQAAKWSSKQDERTLEQKQLETTDCRNEICKQLEAVYDDCGKYLSEKAQKIETIEKAVHFRQRVSDFEKKLPLIEKMIGRLGLSNDKIATVLQKLKTRIQLVKEATCELSSKPTAPGKNFQILKLYREDSIGDIAVPGEIQRRIDQARRSQMSLAAKVGGYIRALGSGVLAAGIAAITGAAIGLGLSYSGGAASLAPVTPLHTATLAAVPTLVWKVYRDCSAHSQEIRNKAGFAEDELNACKENLKEIYQDVARGLQDSRKSIRVPADMQSKLATIRNEIQKLALVKDPAEILGVLA